MAANAALVTTAPTRSQRTLWIHAGMHKTGTKVLQSALRAFDDLPRGALCYPRSSRSGDGFPAHFSIARELLGGSWRPELGGLDAAIEEIAASGCPVACVSAEAFNHLFEWPAALERFRDAALAAGYVPRVVLYLRSQADYLESLYPQLLVGESRLTFAQFLRCALEDGKVPFTGRRGNVVSYATQYGPVLDVFRSVFGARGIVARAFDADAPRDRIVRDFFGVMGVELPPGHDTHAVLNVRGTADAVLRRMHANLAAQPDAEAFDEAAIAGAPFKPLGLVDLVRIARRFRRDDARIAREYGAAVVPVTARRWREAWAAALGADRSARAVRRAVHDADARSRRAGQGGQ